LPGSGEKAHGVERRKVIECGLKLHRLLGEHEDHIEIVGEAADGVAAVQVIERFSPDVARRPDSIGFFGFQL
jgi:AmiR/NasT family two-component response regulator